MVYIEQVKPALCSNWVDSGSKSNLEAPVIQILPALIWNKSKPRCFICSFCADGLI